MLRSVASRCGLLLLVLGLALPAAGTSHDAKSKPKKESKHVSVSSWASLTDQSSLSSHWIFDYSSSFEKKHDNKLTSKEKVGKKEKTSGSSSLIAKLTQSNHSILNFLSSALHSIKLPPRTNGVIVEPIPEPGAALLFAVGTAIVALRLRRTPRPA